MHNLRFLKSMHKNFSKKKTTDDLIGRSRIATTTFTPIPKINPKTNIAIRQRASFEGYEAIRSMRK